jgi:transcriptional regulator with XRE-family HTH domain
MRPEELKKIQRIARLTNIDLAEKTGVSVSLVEKWRKGTRKISESHAVEICGLLK